MYGTVSSLPFPDNMFDFVTAIETYYFWPDLINDLIEVKRVLKPEAFLLLVHAAYKDDQFEKRNSKLVNLLDIKIHTPDEYKDFLSEAGYQIEKINNLPEKNWISAVAQKSESYRDRKEPHSSPLPHHRTYGSVYGDSADQNRSQIQGNESPRDLK